jgi:O-acetyl-ADP-ribose deacetylase (regulator of RNase III)
MSNHLFVAQGDISRFAADAVAYSTSTHLGTDGFLYSAFQRNVPGFEEKYAELGKQHGRSCQVGDAFWLPLECADGGKPRGVVVTPAAGDGPTRHEKRPTAAAAALKTAVEHLRSATGDERLLIALPTFGFGLGGDRRRRLESAKAQMIAAHQVLQSHSNVDAAFVAYTADAYEVLLRARREVELASDDLLQEGPVEELIDALRKRECVVFAGAGLSQGAGLPSWSEFIRHLAEDLGAPHGAELEYFLDVAQWHREQKGEDRLAEQIRRHFGPGRARPTMPHYHVASLPVRVVVTTNYDDLLEQTLDALRRYPTMISEESDVTRTGHGEGVSVVKLHGDAATGRRFVLSRDDFDRFLRQRPAMAVLLEGMLLNHSFFFVGYGLRDPNFRQIHGRIADMLQSAKRMAFAAMVDAPSEITPFVRRQWANKGLHLLFMPGDNLAQRVHSLSRFLDQLAEAVHPASLFLADDADNSDLAEQTPRLESLRRILRENAGDEVEAIISNLEPGASEQETLRVAATLAFLTAHGWRPRGKLSLTKLWERLAHAAVAPYDRKRLLIAALRHAEQHRDIVRLKGQIDSSLKSASGLPPSGH